MEPVLKLLTYLQEINLSLEETLALIRRLETDSGRAEDDDVLMRVVRAHTEFSADFLDVSPAPQPSSPAPQAKGKRPGAKRTRLPAIAARRTGVLTRPPECGISLDSHDLARVNPI